MQAESTVNFKYYPPLEIFSDNSNPKEMTGLTNIDLAISFYHSRSQFFEEKRKDGRFHKFSRNTGAVQLYKDDGVTKYLIPGNEQKEYNDLFTYNYFDALTCSYGYSQILLMRDVLDDLITGHKDDREIKHPSHPDNSRERLVEGSYGINSPIRLFKDFEILRNLTYQASYYKEYLERKKIIVKMWSERPPFLCHVDEGGSSSDFLLNICPEGSQHGFIVNDYSYIDNKNGAPKVRTAFEQFKDAYQEYSNKKAATLKGYVFKGHH